MKKDNILLKIDNIIKIFKYGVVIGKKFTAVDSISFIMENRPQILTIAGESGSGKTTLARIILGFLQPERGKVIYRNKDVYKLKGKEKIWYRKEVQAVFQDPFEAFNPMRKIYTYLYETTKNIVGIEEKNDIDEHINQTLEMVGLSLEEIKGKYPHEFSGGQLQRVAIARALLTKPKLIIADEPVSMIDASLRINILNIFKEIEEKFSTSFIYITHDLATAYYISDEIIIMYRGVIVEKGPIEDVMKEPLHPYTTLLLDSIPVPDITYRAKWLKASKLSGLEIKEFLIKGCKYSDRCPYSSDKCIRERPRLIKIDKNREVACWLYS